MDARTAGRRMTELLNLTSRPVAVTFTAAAPAGVPRVAKAGPASCAYWKQAAEGAVFYTEAADHYNCPLGSYTHGVTLPPSGPESSRTWSARSRARRSATWSSGSRRWWTPTGRSRRTTRGAGRRSSPSPCPLPTGERVISDRAIISPP